MSDDQQQALIGSRGLVAGGQVWGQSSLGTAKDAFRVPTPSVFFARELSLHFTAVRSARNLIRPPAVVNGNDCLRDFPVFSAAAMVFFGIVSSIAQQAADANVLRCLLHGRQEARRVVAGAATDNRREHEVASMIRDHREFKKTTQPVRPARASATVDEVATGIMSLKSGRIDAGFAGGRQQFEFPSPANNFS
jgi:hypothetical protein